MLRGLLELTPGRRPDPARRGRVRGRDPQALHHRRHEPRRPRPRGARDARGGDEPDRRDVELRRGRRGHPPQHARPERRRAPLADQAGGVGALRRHRPLPLLGRPDPDQDLAGRQAGRGRPASRPQGRPLHRPAALRHPGRRADLAPAPPRHLLDRGPEAADLRPALRQPARHRLGQAGRRGRGRHGRRRGRQGGRRPRRDRGPRRRHRRLAAVVDPAGGRARGRSAWPRPSRRCCETTCARGSSSRSTAACARAATCWSGRCSAPTSSASPPPR